MSHKTAMCFNVFSTVHHSIDLFHLPTVMHNSFIQLTICMLHYNPRHVSSINMPIFRRTNYIITASGMSLSVKGFTVCLADESRLQSRAVCSHPVWNEDGSELVIGDSDTCSSTIQTEDIVVLPWKRFRHLYCWGCLYVDRVWNVMALAQKPDFVFRRNGRVHLNLRGRQFSRLLAVEVCASGVVMLDTPCSEVVWRVLVTHSIRQFPLHFPPFPRASPCAITFHLDSNSPTQKELFTFRWQQWSSERSKMLCFSYIAYLVSAFMILVTERVFSRVQFILNVVSISC